jgi:hypothetical protein
MFVPGTAVTTLLDGSLDWILMLHIGDAYIRAGMQNLFDRRMVYVPYYPIPGRLFHLGVTWALFD